MTCKSKNRRGFTLIELGMVMAVVGMMLTGAFYGYRLYEEAQVKAVYTTVQTITQAYKQFKSKYNAVPGDMPDAQTRIKGCTGNCGNGNGNGFIGRTGQAIHNNFDLTIADDRENTQFWYHLQRAELIKMVDPTVSASVTANAAFGRTAPKVKPHGGLVMRVINRDVCDTGTGRPADLIGTWIVWQGQPLSADTVIDTRYAASLDEKYDDGQPGYGNIRASDGDWRSVNNSCRTDLRTYRGAGQGRCYMFFRISRDIN